MNVANLFSQQVQEYSIAGFFPLKDSGREVASMNPAWRFTKDLNGDLKSQAHLSNYDDSSWEIVSLPNGMEYLPVEASGGVNYRGQAWYRKHFTLDKTYQNKRLVLYFEGIMGKSKVWINGHLVSEHFGGFLPLSVEIDKYLSTDNENVIAVWCDNSNDPLFPPGKPQETLDFCYFGGIYRDCWLISTNPDLYITDTNMVDKKASGGLFITYPKVTSTEAIIDIKEDIYGEGKISYTLKDKEGKTILKSNRNRFSIKNPHLWSPDNPYLYSLIVELKDKKGNIKDGFIKKIGIRSVSFTHKDGFILNGKPYPRKLIGANRHQDFAVVGNALSNNLHWRDAQKLKDAGMDIIRNAHYPQDPAFMDACDALGLFVIVNTPGWQFWNDQPIFEQRVYSDIRNMVRRDRNHPSVIMWEPILNETWYPIEFAKNANTIVKEEYPEAYTACDLKALGSEYFDIIFTHPANGGGGAYGDADRIDSTKVYFTREFGDNVDDWNSHNSPSRVALQWGEIPQLIQAKHYMNPDYKYTSVESLNNTPSYHFGGTVRHSFDHQRGYHPDPFYGGIMNSFRRPKFSYYAFQAQADYCKPMVFIANEMTPFSPQDITVFTNCDSVRLRTYVGDTLRIKAREGRWVTFEGAYDFMANKEKSRANKHAETFILAEGIDKNGKVIATNRREMARRASNIRLLIDTLSAMPVADGSDLVVVVAQVTDANGNIKRLNNGIITFQIEGEGAIIGDSNFETNPVPVLWGEACVLVRTSLNAGKIKVTASMILEGDNTPESDSIDFETVKPLEKSIYSSQEASQFTKIQFTNQLNSNRISDEQRKEVEQLLREVEQQQEAFGETNN